MGRGFAVVAEEVRSLAQRTAGATAEIQTLIAGLQAAARQSVEGMRAQVEHAEATANQAQAADGALDKIVGAIQTISDTAIRIAEITAQQSGAVSEIRDHSERIHQLGGDNLLRIGEGREQGRTCWYWVGNYIPPCRPSASDTNLCRSCRRLRSFDLASKNKKIAAFDSAYRTRGMTRSNHSVTNFAQTSVIVLAIAENWTVTKPLRHSRRVLTTAHS